MARQPMRKCLSLSERSSHGQAAGPTVDRGLVTVTVTDEETRQREAQARARTWAAYVLDRLLGIYTQAALARKLGIEESYLNRMVSGEKPVHLHVLDPVFEDPAGALLLADLVVERANEIGRVRLAPVRRVAAVARDAVVSWYGERAIARGFVEDWIDDCAADLGTDEDGVRLALQQHRAVEAA